MKILIIEDEAPASRRLMKLVKECDANAEIVGVVQSVKEGIEWFSTNPLPDLILSDIQLADDLSFKIFSQLKIKTPIIFTTAYDEYAINAFKFYSIDYLLKPINQADLQESLNKYKSILQEKQATDFESILKNFINKEYRERFLVYHGDNLIPIMVNDVAYFESEDGVTFLTTKSGKRHIISESLDQLENELNAKAFFRANRQFILSVESIEKIHNFGRQKLKIQVKPASDKEIYVSKLRATQFKNWLDK
ncbi:MAG TPA: LytTR family DNA-binding domain-containing protein [Bacteroidales bacterium]|nr:LytTR family DNA-binding domain-containing protein [Bacteroidales bacterium]